jgi:hypothetical protein
MDLVCRNDDDFYIVFYDNAYSMMCSQDGEFPSVWSGHWEH